MESTSNSWTPWPNAYFIIRMRWWGQMRPLPWILRVCSAVLSSRWYKNWVKNLLKPFWVSKWIALIERTGRYFQRFFHLGERMQVWTASLVFKIDNIRSNTQLGKSLILSLFSSMLCVFIVSEAIVRQQSWYLRVTKTLLLLFCEVILKPAIISTRVFRMRWFRKE